MNLAYKKILIQLGRPGTERTQTADTVDEQQYYQGPPDFLFMKTLTITVGSVTYPVIEIESQYEWDWINRTSQYSDVPQFFFIRPRFGMRGSEIGIWPIPSSDDNTINLVYEASDKDLSIDAYTTGTVTATEDSATITGAGTTFITPMIGRYFTVTGEYGDGMFYRIVSRTSNLVITLENVYEGATVAGKTYKICEMFNLPEDMQDLPSYFALWHYFSQKKDKEKVAEYLMLYRDGLAEGKRTHGTKTRSNIIRKTGWMDRSGSYPGWFPTDGVSS